MSFPKCFPSTVQTPTTRSTTSISIFPNSAAQSTPPTIELLLGDFVSIGSNFNTFISSADDHFALFRRNSEDVLELKTTGNGRIKIKGCLELLQNSLITVTYTQSGQACIYVNGELRGEISTVAGSLDASDLFIGHTDQAKTFDTTYRAIRFYDRALSAEEAMANAVADGVAAN